MITTIMVLIPVVLVLGFLAALTWMAAVICYRAGLSPWLGLLMLVPLVNLAAIWVFAFTPWPAVDEPG